MKKINTTSEVEISNFYNSNDVEIRNMLKKHLLKSPIPTEELFQDIYGLMNYIKRLFLCMEIYLNLE